MTYILSPGGGGCLHHPGIFFFFEGRQPMFIKLFTYARLCARNLIHILPLKAPNLPVRWTGFYCSHLTDDQTDSRSCQSDRAAGAQGQLLEIRATGNR